MSTVDVVVKKRRRNEMVGNGVGLFGGRSGDEMEVKEGLYSCLMVCVCVRVVGAGAIAYLDLRSEQSLDLE